MRNIQEGEITSRRESIGETWKRESCSYEEQKDTWRKERKDAGKEGVMGKRGAGKRKDNGKKGCWKKKGIREKKETQEKQGCGK